MNAELPRKSLSYKILTETKLLSVNEAIQGRLQIVYEGVAIQNIHLLKLEILNDGNVPITPTDFVEPLNFETDGKILSAEIIETAPNTFAPKLNVGEHSILIEPTLFNSKDSLSIKLFVDRYKKLDAKARIVGVREVKRIEEYYTRPKLVAIFAILVSASVAVLLTWPIQATSIKIPDVLVAVLGGVFVELFARYWDLRNRIKKSP